MEQKSQRLIRETIEGLVENYIQEVGLLREIDEAVCTDDVIKVMEDVLNRLEDDNTSAIFHYATDMVYEISFPLAYGIKKIQELRGQEWCYTQKDLCELLMGYLEKPLSLEKIRQEWQNAIKKREFDEPMQLWSYAMLLPIIALPTWTHAVFAKNGTIRKAIHRIKEKGTPIALLIGKEKKTNDD